MRLVKFNINNPDVWMDVIPETENVLSVSTGGGYIFARYMKDAVTSMKQLDYDGKLPVYVYITEGSVADNKGAYDIPLEKGSVIVADRYYNDFPLLNIWDSNGVFFVIRHKDNLAFHTINERELPENTAQQVLKDEEIELTNSFSAL